ncbi:hypothetical protein [Winogradskyella eximia]|nr:hypothetical protein [Winogradskyella eximia]
MSNRYTLKEVLNLATVGDESFYYSICIFRYTKNPNFLIEPVEGVYETKYSFLLLTEYSNYIIVYKSNISGLKSLKEYIEPIDYNIISRLFVEDKTLFEKFYVSNMSTADNAIRSKSLEANNLKGTISRIGAPKQVIHNMRVVNDRERTSLSLNTSRINNLGDKRMLQDFFVWLVQVTKKIIAFTPRDTYLDSFAQPVDFDDYKDNLEPICILIKFDKLLDEIEREGVERIYQVDDEDNEIEGFELNPFIDNFKTTLAINEEEDVYMINNLIDPEMRLSIASKSIRINSPELKKVKIDKGGDAIFNLNSYINNRNDFIVNFSETDLIYTYRKLFRDHRLLNDIDSFLSVFIAHPGLSTTTSEKGDFAENQTEFEVGSIFRFIRDELANDSIALFCDDLGNEWADLISVENDNIIFYHAKHKDGHSLSASALQDVIGQAHKNLGNLEPTDRMLETKANNKWSNNYNNDGVETEISRLMIAPNNSIEEAIDKYKTSLFLPNVKRQVNIVIDFISKQELSDGLDLLVDNQAFARRNEVTQILWFVSSLIANCKELGIETYITCRP